MPYMAAFSAPLPPTPRVLRCFGHPRANSIAIYGILGIARRIRLLFTAPWASQSEFACDLLYSWHHKANSLAIYGTLGVPGRVRSLYAAFRSHVFRRCLTGAALRYCHCGGVGEATWICFEFCEVASNSKQQLRSKQIMKSEVIKSRFLPYQICSSAMPVVAMSGSAGKHQKRRIIQGVGESSS